jgi:uncharacterized membrane protein
MTVLVLGLVLFLGTHSVRIFADDWRSRQIARLGEGPWKGIYSLLSAAGLVLIVWGYGLARAQPTLLWAPPVAMRHVSALLVLIAFILIAAAHVKGNRIKARLGHPMVAGVKVWAFAHLIANGTLNAVVLFGAFLAWAILDFMSARRRDRRAGTVYPVGPVSRDAIAIVAGVIGYGVFAFWLHGWWIGVRPFG